jgi:hypothetical protein
LYPQKKEKRSHGFILRACHSGPDGTVIVALPGTRDPIPRRKKRKKIATLDTQPLARDYPKNATVMPFAFQWRANQTRASYCISFLNTDIGPPGMALWNIACSHNNGSRRIPMNVSKEWPIAIFSLIFHAKPLDFAQSLKRLLTAISTSDYLIKENKCPEMMT